MVQATNVAIHNAIENKNPVSKTAYAEGKRTSEINSSKEVILSAEKSNVLHPGNLMDE
jgi:hypothetical protein